jgi:AcrR family transcriptional regulator
MSRLPASERLAAIATAATEVFGRLGYRGTRTADVAARAGMSAGSLFTYVESKEALFHLVFLYGLDRLPEDPALPLGTPEPGETAALFGRALHESAVSRIQAALAGSGPVDAGEELRGIVEELYETVERDWPLLAVVERCAAELPELETLWFGEARAGIFAELAEYLRRGAASGRLRPMPDATVAARLVAELVAWFAWHRRNSHDAGLYDDQLARRTVIEFVCAALVPLGPIPKSTPKEDESWTEHD